MYTNLSWWASRKDPGTQQMGNEITDIIELSNILNWLYSAGSISAGEKTFIHKHTDTLQWLWEINTSVVDPLVYWVLRRAALTLPVG